MSQIIKQEGFRGLYKGLVASIMREVGYSGIRLGAYEHVKEALGGTDKRNTPLHIKVAAGALTGSVGAVSHLQPCRRLSVHTGEFDLSAVCHYTH